MDVALSHQAISRSEKSQEFYKRKNESHVLKWKSKCSLAAKLSFGSLDKFQVNQGKSVLIWTDSAFPAESHSFRGVGTTCPAHTINHDLLVPTCPTQPSICQGHLLKGGISQAWHSIVWKGNGKSFSSHTFKKIAASIYRVFALLFTSVLCPHWRLQLLKQIWPCRTHIHTF